MEEKLVSENGIEIYGYKNESLHGFFISLFLRAGSMYEEARDSGITHFLEHAAIRNVNKVMNGELYSILDREGIEFNASTYSEMVQFYVYGEKSRIRLGIDVLLTLFSPIILDREELELERRRIKAEIREADEKNSIISLSSSQIHGETSLSRSITGTLGSVSKITKARLENYRRKVFTPGNAFFYITGNYAEEDIFYLKEALSKLKLQKAEKINDNIAPVSEKHFKRDGEVTVRNSEYTVVRFSFDMDMSKISSEESDLIYDILLSGYNSRFFIEMSERRGLFYDISGAVERYKNIGEFHFSYEVKEGELYEAVSLTVDILNDFKNTLLSEDEMMKAGYAANAYLLLDDPRELNFTFAYDNHVMCEGYEDVEARRRAYLRVSPESLRRAAGELFLARNLTLTVKGRKKKLDTARLKEITEKLGNY